MKIIPIYPNVQTVKYLKEYVGSSLSSTKGASSAELKNHAKLDTQKPPKESETKLDFQLKIQCKWTKLKPRPKMSFERFQTCQ